METLFHLIHLVQGQVDFNRAIARIKVIINSYFACFYTCAINCFVAFSLSCFLDRVLLALIGKGVLGTVI